MCCTVKFFGTIGMSVTVPTDGLEPPLVPLFTRDKQPVAAVRSRLSGSMISKFDCSKLPGDQYAPFDAMGLTAADPKAVLAAADADGVPGAALTQRFNGHLRSSTNVMPLRQTHGRLTLSVKHINDARSRVMMSYDKIEPMIWERF